MKNVEHVLELSLEKCWCFTCPFDSVSNFLKVLNLNMPPDVELRWMKRNNKILADEFYRHLLLVSSTDTYFW